MPDPSYDVTIENGDCNGSCRVNRITNTFYTGGNASYDAVNLQELSTGGWVVTAIVVTKPTSPCYPSVVYTQDTSNADPIGPYGGGKATVAAV